MIRRDLIPKIVSNQKDGFINVIYGPRRVGKTVLLQEILCTSVYKDTTILMLNGDTQESKDALGTVSETQLTNLVKDYQTIVVDEAQRIPNVSLALKIIIDKFPEKRIFVTGSSSLELSEGIQENLTGRTNKYKLYSLSTHELSYDLDRFKLPYLLPSQLIYGGYPYLVSLGTNKEKEEYLMSIIEDYLYKDLFDLEYFSNKETVKKLISLLAFQIGNEVSLSELGRQLMVSTKTVARYIDLLQKSFIIVEFGAFSTNLRNEIARNKKYYFYDLGIRNAVINQFHAIDIRPDIGALWENFLIVERLKKQHYAGNNLSYFFWRDYANAEVDLIEKSSQTIQAYEFKWTSKKQNIKTPKAFKENYDIDVKLVSKDTYLDFVL